MTPLHVAAERGFLKIVDYLVGKGADIDIKDENGVIRPVAKIFRRGLHIYICLHMYACIKHASVGLSGDLLSQEIFQIRSSEFTSEDILGQKHSCRRCMGCRVLHPV